MTDPTHPDAVRLAILAATGQLAALPAALREAAEAAEAAAFAGEVVTTLEPLAGYADYRERYAAMLPPLDRLPVEHPLTLLDEAALGAVVEFFEAGCRFGAAVEYLRRAAAG